MTRCASCDKPLEYPEDIIFWQTRNGIHVFIHVRCENQWAAFVELRDGVDPDLSWRHSPDHLVWRATRQADWWRFLRELEQKQEPSLGGTIDDRLQASLERAIAELQPGKFNAKRWRV